MKSDTCLVWKPEEYSYELSFGFIPKITSYLHEDGVKRPCILVVPGGGYCVVSPTEGELVALKFYEKGYQAFVLTYTTNLLMASPLKLQPLNDISRAVRYIRKNADEYNVKENNLIICGFSAGGHLCGSLCVHYEDIVDGAEEYAGISNRPDAAILCYPVITSGENAHRDSFIALLGNDATLEELEYMSLEKQVREQTPPCFLWATATDEAVPVENSEMFANACRKKGVPCSFHMFTSGAHGLSLANDDWANGVHAMPYTMEQIMKTADKVASGELAVPEEVKARFSQMKMQQLDGPIGIPNPEVSVWPELADAFVKGLNLK